MKNLIISAGLLFSISGMAIAQSVSSGVDNITISAKYNAGKSVEIKWVLSSRFEKASANKLTGFKVYRSDQPKHGFTLLTTELLPPQTRNYKDPDYSSDSPNYYKIEASDINGNKIVSAPASPVIINNNLLALQEDLLNSIAKKREAQARVLEDQNNAIVSNNRAASPPKSTFKSVKTSLNKVDITFAKAKAKDFNRVELSRKSMNGRRWEVIHTLKGDVAKEDIVRYRDQKIEPGREYIYRLQTIDNNGMKSPFEFSNAVKTINRVAVKDIQKISAKRTKGQVVLSWSYESSNEFFFIVYRTFEDGTLRQIGRSETNTFNDKRPPNGTVSYAVKPMRKDGNRGMVSEMVLVK